jgi:hypothetical protein
MEAMVSLMNNPMGVSRPTTAMMERKDVNAKAVRILKNMNSI